MKKQKKKQFNVVLDEDLIVAIKQMAINNNMSFSKMVNQMLKEKLKLKEVKNER